MPLMETRKSLYSPSISLIYQEDQTLCLMPWKWIKKQQLTLDKVERVFTRRTPLVYLLQWSLVQFGTCQDGQLKPAVTSNTTTEREFLDSGSPERTQRHMTWPYGSRVHENLKYKFNSDIVMSWRLHRVWSKLDGYKEELESWLKHSADLMEKKYLNGSSHLTRERLQKQ